MPLLLLLPLTVQGMSRMVRIYRMLMRLVLKCELIRPRHLRGLLLLTVLWIRLILCQLIPLMFQQSHGFLLLRCPELLLLLLLITQLFMFTELLLIDSRSRLRWTLHSANCCSQPLSRVRLLYFSTVLLSLQMLLCRLLLSRAWQLLETMRRAGIVETRRVMQASLLLPRGLKCGRLRHWYILLCVRRDSGSCRYVLVSLLAKCRSGRGRRLVKKCAK